MFMEQVGSLNFMKGNDDILEENDVLFSEGNCETGNNGSKDVE